MFEGEYVERVGEDVGDHVSSTIVGRSVGVRVVFVGLLEGLDVGGADVGGENVGAFVGTFVFDVGLVVGDSV